MVILGIDPGTARVGYGVIKTSPRLSLIKAGLLKVSARERAMRLEEIKEQTALIIKKLKPAILAVEKLFFMRNQKTAMSVAEARGAVLIAAAEVGLKVVEFAPNEIKAGVTGYGLADKKAVLKMVRLTLGEPKLKVIDDASDALAAAILAALNIKNAP